MSDVLNELILGGQKSGKSRCAEDRAAAWLAGAPGRSAVLLATALAGDNEMRERIARHQADRAERVPALKGVEVGAALGLALRRHSTADRLVVVDCLTLWLTQGLMPLDGPGWGGAELQAARDDLLSALRDAAGPVVCVSNEIGLGLSPLSGAARRFVDELGRLHQAVAAQCGRVTLMVAGLECPIRRTGSIA